MINMYSHTILRLFTDCGLESTIHAVLVGTTIPSYSYQSKHAKKKRQQQSYITCCDYCWKFTGMCQRQRRQQRYQLFHIFPLIHMYMYYILHYIPHYTHTYAIFHLDLNRTRCHACGCVNRIYDIHISLPIAIRGGYCRKKIRLYCLRGAIVWNSISIQTPHSSANSI